MAMAAPGEGRTMPIEIILVEPEMVTTTAISQWKKEAFKGVAVVLDERTSEAAYRSLGRNVSEGGLDLYCWIEVARNPKMAAAHPRWMAALGSHQDWQKNFPKFPEPGVGQVAKAFPWVPIAYRETFDAHLARIDALLKRAPTAFRGLLLNDLQGGPSSCGCGNLQCRWAIDYQVSSTATSLNDEIVAARFVAEVRKRAPRKEVIPVWTTECSEADLPPNKNGGRPGTGFCGTLACVNSACSEVFTRQWTALALGHDRPMGVLAVHNPLKRIQVEFGGGSGWVTNAMAYVNQTCLRSGAVATPVSRLWVVIEGAPTGNETFSRDLAAKAGVGGVIVARTRIDQSYEPRMISTK